jgi:hypothetical protein
MRIAVALNGNLRTFFMPMHENSDLRVCDLFYKNVIETNDNCDIFICCGLTDFFMDGFVYYTDNTIETTNDNGCRVYNKIKFIDKETAKSMITKKLNETFKNIKEIQFAEDNPEIHPNFLKMKNCKHYGIAVELLINQHNKIFKLKENIEKTNITYDYIIRSRFDFVILRSLNLSNYNVSNNNIYTPGFEGNKDLVYDWCSFGNSDTMLKCMNLYNELDFIKPTFSLRCNACGLKFKEDNNNCVHGIIPGDVSLSSETQLARLFKNNNFSVNAGIHGTVYRYMKDYSQTVKDVLPEGLSGIKVINYTPGDELFSITEYK